MVPAIQLDPEIIREFVAESDENINELERNLVGWEKQPKSRETLDRIFRAFHSLKGTGGLLGYERLESLVHQAENVLSGIRDGYLAVNTETVTAFLKTLDALRVLLRQIGDTGEDEDEDYEVLVAELGLKTLQKQVSQQAEQKMHEGEEAREPEAAPAAANTIRVGAAGLDHLLALAEKLVREHGRLEEVQAGNGASAEACRAIGALLAELRGDILKMRRQPMETLWNRFPRLIRDAALSVGKKIRLETAGGNLEIDRGILEVVGEAITHLVRNCIDHGIELPEKRLAQGKSEEGRILLLAVDGDDHIIVEVGDDGAGLKLDLIRETALQRSLITRKEAEAMNAVELSNLIFLPGFSTMTDATKLSGRGVGMNVVKTNLENIGGNVEVISDPGKGALFRIRLPKGSALVSDA
jgi:two-component system chemotaxis sensor kinase CheA